MTNKITGYYGVSAPDRKTLVAASAPTFNAYSGPFLHVSLPCGHVREWARAEDVPDHNVECKCGELDYAHFFVFYGGKP